MDTITKHEVFNSDTGQVQDVIECTEKYAVQANIDFHTVDSPIRYIKQRELPSENCSCGAEYKYECVCEF